MSIEAFFLPMDHGRRGQRFCVFHPPVGALVRGLIVHVHPFAEEMNKSRRMTALAARTLAEAGYGVLRIDLLGCGDSSGEFGDATWHDWVADVLEACRWAQRRLPAPLWLWGLRAGCLLAVEAAQALDGPCHFLFWQPPASGKLLAQQFLRLKVAGDMLDGKSKGVMEGLRQSLAQGRAVDVAGYALAPGLVDGFEAAGMQPPSGAGRGGRVEWIEVSSRADASLSPASERALAAWRSAGSQVRAHLANGPAFWQTTEIESAPALLPLSLQALEAVEVVAA